VKVPERFRKSLEFLRVWERAAKQCSDELFGGAIAVSLDVVKHHIGENIQNVITRQSQIAAAIEVPAEVTAMKAPCAREVKGVGGLVRAGDEF
jgi:hypothetical protein